MEINCSYCKNCDTLWDDKEVENGLCFDCQETLTKMVARPVEAAQHSVRRTALSVRVLNAICYGTTLATFLWLLFGSR